MPKAFFLVGDSINLCPLEPDDDLDDYLSWVNDQEITRYMATGNYPVSRKNLQDYIMSFHESKGLLLGIFTKKEEKHIGNITVHSIDHQNRIAEIGILIGNKDMHLRGFGLEALSLVVYHAFIRLNLNKLCAGLVKGNVASQRLFEKAGFKREGILREHFYLDGKYLDCYRMGLLRDEFKANT